MAVTKHETETEVNTSKKNDESINRKKVKPYNRFFHPHKSWIDIIISLITEYFFPLSKLQSYEPKSASEETTEVMQTFRTSRFLSIAENQAGIKLKAWNDSLKDDGGLFECTINVPCREDILSEWGICDKTDRSESVISVPMHFTLPRYLIKENMKMKGEDYEFNLKDIDSSVSILLWFYGGGMILACNDGNEIDIARSLSKAQQENGVNASKQSNSHAIVLARIEYRLAPEDPFPASIIDSLTAASYILDNSTCSLNIGGISAGGNLATVVALECHRRYKGRIRSACIQVPMLSPQADSSSYVLNSTSSGCCPIEFLRWSWRAYLQLDNNDHNNSDKGNHEPNNIGALGRNKKWCECEKNPLWRLICPTNSLPTDLDNHDQSPKFIILTALADPLHDEGVELFEKFRKAGANVVHVESRGSHAISLMLDSKARNALEDAWRSGIFSNEQSDLD